MTQLTKNLYCIKMRSGIELWLEKDRTTIIQENLEHLANHVFINIGEETFNTADIEGVFSAQTVETYRRLKRGQWQCLFATWHDKKEECLCEKTKIEETEKEYQTRKLQAIKGCRKCENGWVFDIGKNARIICSCIKNIQKNDRLQ